MGFEPTWLNNRGILSPLRLPISPYPLIWRRLQCENRTLKKKGRIIAKELTITTAIKGRKNMKNCAECTCICFLFGLSPNHCSHYTTYVPLCQQQFSIIFINFCLLNQFRLFFRRMSSHRLLLNTS